MIYFKPYSKFPIFFARIMPPICWWWWLRWSSRWCKSRNAGSEEVQSLIELVSWDAHSSSVFSSRCQNQLLFSIWLQRACTWASSSSLESYLAIWLPKCSKWASRNSPGSYLAIWLWKCSKAAIRNSPLVPEMCKRRLKYFTGAILLFGCRNSLNEPPERSWQLFRHWL